MSIRPIGQLVKYPGPGEINKNSKYRKYKNAEKINTLRKFRTKKYHSLNNTLKESRTSNEGKIKSEIWDKTKTDLIKKARENIENNFKEIKKDKKEELFDN